MNQPNDIEFIFQCNYNQIVLALSRAYVKDFKKFLKSKRKSFTFKRTLEFIDDVPIKIRTVKYVYGEDEDFAFDLDSYVDSNNAGTYVVINVNMKVESFPNAYNDFIAEIKDSLRHELEHVSQFNNADKAEQLEIIKEKDILGIKNIKNKSKYIKYVLEYEELYAYLHGFHQNSKTRKITMNQVIDEWINIRTFEYKSEEEIAMVKKLYKEFGRLVLPNANWNETILS